MKNGFTLVELLATIVIISIITLIGTVGISSARKGINQSMWNTNIELIENSGASFGSDKKAYIETLTTSCNVDGTFKSPCLTVTVQTLIDRGYLNTKDYINYKGTEKFKVVVNKTVDKSDNEDENFENGYYVNNNKVGIYIENDITYARYFDTSKTIDYILPSVSSVTVTSTTYNSIAISVTGTKGSNDVASYMYSIDGGSYTTTSSNTYTFTGLTENTSHTINVKVKDSAGKESTEYSKTQNTATYVSPSITNVTSSSTSSSITVKATGKNGNGTITKYYYSKNNGSNYVESTSNSYTFSSLAANTTYYIKVKAIDNNNKVSNIYSLTVKTDFVKPSISSITVSDNKPSEIKITTNAVAGSNAIASYYYSINNGSYVSSTSNVYAFTGLTGNTTYTIKVYAVDSASNKSDVYTHSVTTSKAANSVILANKSIGSRGDLGDDYTTITTNKLFSTTDSQGTSYYFAGNPTDNYVSFAGFYWRIVRINGDGSIRLIYNGTSASATGENVTIGKSAWNSDTTIAGDNAGVGYMYGTAGKWTDKGAAGRTWTATFDKTETYKYSTSYSFNAVTGMYTLSGTIYTGSWSSSMVGKYSCFNENTSCKWIRYVSSYTNSTQGRLTGFDKGDYGNITSRSVTHANTNNSTIKTKLDSWYQTNIENKGYSKYIDTDAGFCNDRRPSSSDSTINYAGGYSKQSTYYGQNVARENDTYALSCSQTNDYFTPTTSSYGNKKLTKPVGMITMEEVAFAGNEGSYLSLDNKVVYWTMSPSFFETYSSFVGFVYAFGAYVINVSVDTASYANVRPVINISKNVKLSGAGTISNPYTIS